jgi:hypothetical protein|tara:strand:+ start:26325 stop:26570 length:246 start_codon:yes stop_codon:yes gene_type:complete
MRFAPLIIGLGVSACSGTPTTELIVDKNIHALSRTEVIMAIEECHSVDLRPVMFYTQRMINEKNVPVVIDVTCAPKGNYKQ